MWRICIALALAACGLEPGMGDWDTNFIQNTNVNRTGDYAIECPADLTGTIRSDMIPVTPGQPYRASVGLRHKGAGAVGGQDDMNAYVEWFTTAEVTISTDDVFAMGILAAQNTWYDFEVIADAPATAGFCQLVWDVDGSANSVAHYKDIFSIKEHPHSFRAYLATVNQNIPDTTSTVILFNNESYDHGGSYNNATGVWTCPYDGLYLVNASVTLHDAGGFNGAGTTAFLQYKVNAGYTGRDRQFLVTGDGNPAGNILHASDTLNLVAGDTVAAAVYHNDGQVLQALISVSTTWFSISQLHR